MRGKKMHRASGGKVRADEMEASDGGGDPEVIKEAEEKKRGGRAKRKHGGKIEGKMMKHRMDRPRPGRQSGGRVGADKSPLSSANRTTSPEALPKSQESGMSK